VKAIKAQQYEEAAAVLETGVQFLNKTVHEIPLLVVKRTYLIAATGSLQHSHWLQGMHCCWSSKVQCKPSSS
jgi:hypothetical protein